MTDGGDQPGPLARVRRNYERADLHLDGLGDDERGDPLLVVGRWLDEAVAAGSEVEPTAMTLATTEQGPDGPRPDARVVLCKGIDRGLVFYTNQSSAKGTQLAAAPVAAAVFLWASLERQVRARGAVEVVDDATSDAYFASRPRGSQLGAWTSDQSRPVPDRATLDRRAREAAARFDGQEVPRPPDWGGYRLVPTEVELWQGRPDRLHDRLRFTRDDDVWDATRLQP